MKMQRKVLAPSPWQPLDWQGVLRIPGSKIHKEEVGVRFGSWNVGSISGRGMEVCEKLRKRRVDVCCTGSEMERQRSSLLWHQGKKV